MIKLVVFDLDNVIIDGEGIDEIGKLINIEDQIAAITEQAMQGEIDFETSIKKRVGLLKGVATDDIRTLANEMPLMKGAVETVSSLKENGFEVAIISGSFDIIADSVADLKEVYLEKGLALHGGARGGGYDPSLFNYLYLQKKKRPKGVSSL